MPRCRILMLISRFCLTYFFDVVPISPFISLIFSKCFIGLSSLKIFMEFCKSLYTSALYSPSLLLIFLFSWSILLTPFEPLNVSKPIILH